MSMPKILHQTQERTCVKNSLLFICLVLMRIGLYMLQHWNLDKLSQGILILCLFASIELVCSSCYNLISLVLPILMASRALFIHGSASISLVQLLLFFPITVMLIGIPMSICLHRYFSHQAFETSRGMQLVFGMISTLAFQGGPLWWACLHQRHHKNCDKQEDPHSITNDSFMYCFIGWMCSPKNYIYDPSTLDASLRTPEMILVQKFHPVFPLTICLLVENYLGYRYMLFSTLLPMLACRLITCQFNIEFHPQQDANNCKAIDNDRILAKIVGESHHSKHHKNPRSSRRPDYDVPYWLTLFWMEKIGLIWNCK